MIGDPLDICIGITNELYHGIRSGFNELRCWSVVDSIEEDGLEVFLMVAMGGPPAFASIEIECSVDEEEPSERIIEVIERMRLVEDEKTNLDRVDVHKILEEYRKLNPIVVAGTTHRWKRQQERERNSEEELEVNRTLEIVMRTYSGELDVEETDEQSFHEEVTDAALPRLRALVEIYKLTRRM